MFPLSSSWCGYPGHVAMATKWENTEVARSGVEVMEFLTPPGRRQRGRSRDSHLELQPLFPPAHPQLQVILGAVRVHRKWKVNWGGRRWGGGGGVGGSLMWWRLAVLQLFGADSCSYKNIPPWCFISKPNKRIGLGGTIPWPVVDVII